MSDRDHTRRFVAEFAAYEHEIYRYIMTLLPDPNQAQDVFQETALTLWEKFDMYEADRPFVKWAIGIAHLKVLAHRKKYARERLTLSDRTMQLIVDQVAADQSVIDEQRAALRECLGRLNPHERELIRIRYGSNATIQSVAEQTGRPVNTLYKSLDRLRRKLLACMRDSMEGVA